MKLYRIKPNFDTEEYRDSIIGGVFLAVGSFFLGLPFSIYYILQGIDSKDIGVVLVGLFFSPILIFQGVMAIKMALEGISGIIKKNAWLESSAIGQGTIIERREEYYDHGYDIGGDYTYTFGIKIDTIQATSNPDEQCVWAGVSKHVFKKYKHRDTAHIHYSIDTPLNFLIEGE